MKTYDFFTLGNKYKKYFTAELNENNFDLRLFSEHENNYILDYHNGDYSSFMTNKNGYVQFKRNNFNSNKISLRYDNYNIEGLYLCNSYVNKIVLQQLRQLKYLNLSNNDIQYLFLDKCQKLQSLIACNNKVKELDLSKNSFLNTIDLCNNQINKIQFPTIQRFNKEKRYSKSLKQITLCNNKLENITIPSGVKKANLACNNLKIILFENFSQLEYLNVSNNPNLQTLIIPSVFIKKIICKNTQLNQNNIVFLNKKNQFNVEIDFGNNSSSSESNSSFYT